MKTINSNETSPAITKEVTTIEDCPFVKEINKRYGFRIEQQIFICDELRLKKLGWQHSDVFNLNIVPQSHALASQVDTIDLKQITFDSLEELYKLTNTGSYSTYHEFNQDAKDSNSIISLIPVIQIQYKSKTYSFQLNNRFVQEFFDDTELFMTYPLSAEERSIIDRRFKEHKEYLEYFFAPKNSESYSEWWIDVYYNKLISNNNNMLHSEYIELNRNNQKGIFDEPIPFSFSVTPL